MKFKLAQPGAPFAAEVVAVQLGIGFHEGDVGKAEEVTGRGFGRGDSPFLVNPPHKKKHKAPSPWI